MTPITNIDPETGIRYAVISQHRLDPEALDDVIRCGTDLTYEAAKAAARAEVAAWFTRGLQTGADVQRAARDLGLWRERDRTGAAKAYLERGATPDSVWSAIEDAWNDAYDPCGESTYEWVSEDGYTVRLDRDGDLWVLKSPFTTDRGLCSPCAPGACHLETPGRERCYALGVEWFSEDAPIDYVLYPAAPLVAVTA